MIRGYIQNYDGEALTIVAPFQDGKLLERRNIIECEVYLHDGRELSPAQRNETLRSMQLNYLIATTPDNVRRQLTQHYCRLAGIDLFSLASRSDNTIDMTTARDFIDWLVELCVENGIPCMDTLLNRCEDIGRYLYACVANRRCAICGEKAEIHEWDHVGTGRDRRKIHHMGQRVQPLCRGHHSEAHGKGQQTFDSKYHMAYIRLDDYLCEQLGWRK